MKCSLINLFIVYFYYKINFQSMKFSLIGSESENSENIIQWIISWSISSFEIGL